MRKLEVAFVACLITINFLAVSTIWFYQLSGELRIENEQLQDKNSLSSTENAFLKTQQRNLEETIDELENQVDILGTNNDELEQQISNLELQVDEAYDDGYVQGVIDGVGRGFNVRDPTYDETLQFIASDQTDKNDYDEDSYYCFHFTADVEKNAFKQGYRCGFVYMEFSLASAHAIVCFNTTDQGLIFIEPQTDEIVNVAVGEFYECVEFWVGTIKNYVIVW